MSDGAFTSFGVVITGSDTRIRNSVMMCGPQSNSGVADVALVDQKGVPPPSNQCVEMMYLMAAAVSSDTQSSIQVRATLRLDVAAEAMRFEVAAMEQSPSNGGLLVNVEPESGKPIGCRVLSRVVFRSRRTRLHRAAAH